MPSRRVQLILSVACITFLAYFVTGFYIDNGNESEVVNYGTQLVQATASHAIATDSDGRYSVLAQVSFAPLEWLIARLGSGAAVTRAFLVMRLVQALALFAVAYLYYSRLRLGWYARLMALTLLAAAVAYVSLTRGWEFDKLDEAVLFMLAGLVLLRGWFWPLVPLVALAALNRESGVLLPLLYLAFRWPERGQRNVQVRFGALMLLALAIVLPLEALSGGQHLDAVTVAHNLRPPDISYAVGGLAWLPLLAIVWLHAVPPVLRRAFWLLAPAWVVIAILSEQLRNGPLLLPAIAVLCVPIVVYAVQAGSLARDDAAVGASTAS